MNERPELTPEIVWTFMCAGCNAREIAEYGRVSLTVALALMQRAAREQAGHVAHETLRRAA